MRLRYAGLGILLSFASPAIAQQAPPPPAGSDALGDDVIVEGLRDLPEGDPGPANRSGITSNSPASSAVANRVKFEFSERIAGCALRGRIATMAQLRAVIDDAPNKSSQVLAQDRLKRIYVTCSESVQLLEFPTPTLGYSIYDRGAITIGVIRKYAPDLVLTSKETGNPAVQARFDAREIERARYRLPLDLRYFEVAVCMVRLQPRLSLRLVRTDDRKQIAKISSVIVNNARDCVGSARKIYFDPTQFRTFIADAVYRWAVAARGVDTLLPPV